MFLNPKFLLAGSPTSFLNLLEREVEVIGQVSVIDTSSECFSDPGSCAAYVSMMRPDILIHILLSDEELVEPRVPLALHHGLIGTDAIFIHLTDTTLFSGLKGAPYSEEDVPDALGDKAQKVSSVQRQLSNDFVHTVVVRSGNILSSAPTSSLKRLINSAMGRRHMTLNPGNRTSLVSEHQACKFLTYLVKKAVVDTNLCGIYNLACLGTPSEYEWQTFALQLARKIRPDLNWPRIGVRKPTAEEVNTGLDCTKFQLDIGVILPDWQDAVIEATVNQVGLLGQ